MTKRWIMVLAAVLSVACTKVKTDCRYVIVPHVQMEKGGDETTPQGLVAYALYGSSEKWTVASYADALPVRLRMPFRARSGTIRSPRSRTNRAT